MRVQRWMGLPTSHSSTVAQTSLRDLMPGIFPDQTAPIARNNIDGERKLVMARWDMPGRRSRARAPVTNIRRAQARGVAWRSKPSWSIVAAKDRTARLELERFAAKRMGATTVELPSSHVPMLSQPQAVLDAIRKAAATAAARYSPVLA